MKSLFLFISLKVNFFFFYLLWHTACRILVSHQGSNPYPTQWKHRVLTTEPPGKSLLSLLEDVFPLLLSTFFVWSLQSIFVTLGFCECSLPWFLSVALVYPSHDGVKLMWVHVSDQIQRIPSHSKLLLELLLVMLDNLPINFLIYFIIYLFMPHSTVVGS